jgi:hypothetical protein
MKKAYLIKGANGSTINLDPLEIREVGRSGPDDTKILLRGHGALWIDAPFVEVLSDIIEAEASK